jgi:carbonic anhydrase/acetyltransferase-like protein (isoleucine patch superfamily)
MALILPVEEISPKWGDNCFIAPNATIVGDVQMGSECSIWFNTVLRGDVNSIRLGNKVNVQDGAVIHCTYRRSKTLIGNNVSIGHNAIVHGCTVHDNVLIGMGAIVPAKKVKEISPEKLQGEINRIANNYVGYAQWFEEVNEAR